MLDDLNHVGLHHHTVGQFIDSCFNKVGRVGSLVIIRGGGRRRVIGRLGHRCMSYFPIVFCGSKLG